ncbi:hypothetical protein [Kutzneria sp. NPDC051319]|uniref:hypothetical protein n=1 Tax=Kutzneria sp. NPDC051319 TaxID=3155047 RepID=UPI003447994E
MPPIYQPEAAAEAIVHAAAHPRRREYWVGGSTVATILGEKLASGVLDRHLARTGYDAQQVDRTPPRSGPNLWEAVDRQSDHGAHGAFDDTAPPHSRQWWLNSHRGALRGRSRDNRHVAAPSCPSKGRSWRRPSYVS